MPQPIVNILQGIHDWFLNVAHESSAPHLKLTTDSNHYKTGHFVTSAQIGALPITLELGGILAIESKLDFYGSLGGRVTPVKDVSLVVF